MQPEAGMLPGERVGYDSCGGTLWNLPNSQPRGDTRKVCVPPSGEAKTTVSGLTCVYHLGYKYRAGKLWDCCEINTLIFDHQPVEICAGHLHVLLLFEPGLRSRAASQK